MKLTLITSASGQLVLRKYMLVAAHCRWSMFGVL